MLKIQITIEINDDKIKVTPIKIEDKPIDIQMPIEKVPEIKKMSKGYKIPKTKMCIHCGTMFSPQGLAKHKKYCKSKLYKPLAERKIEETNKKEIPLIEIFNGKSGYEKKDGNALRMD
jgi:hypothetical protein